MENACLKTDEWYNSPMAEVVVIFDPKTESYLVEIPHEPGAVTVGDVV